MARRRRRGRYKQWAGRKWLKRGVGIAGSLVGAVIGLSPTFRGLGEYAKGNWNGGTDAILYDTTGLNQAGTLQLDTSKVVRTGITIGAGIVVAMLFKQLARRL